jgi:subtilisin family serine protease
MRHAIGGNMKKVFLTAVILLFAANAFAQSETGRYLVPVKKSDLKTERESVCVLEQCYYIVDKISAERSVLSGEAERYYPEFQRKIFAAPNDPRLSSQWHLTNSTVSWLDGWEKIKDLPSSGSIPVVAVIDTGMSANHEDLPRHSLCGGTTYEAKGVSPAYLGIDRLGHGTHVAGIIGALTNNSKGVASVSGGKVRVMSIRVETSCSDPNETGCLGGAAILDAINQILEKKKAGAPIVAVNMSYGDEGIYATANSREYEHMKDLRDHGIIAVVSAGNGDEAGDGQNLGASWNSFPAEYNLQNIVTVASVSDTLGRAEYSNYGEIVGIAAPGSTILSLGHSYGSPYTGMSGTSMAAPFIAGLLGAGAALYNKDKETDTYLDITAAQLMNILYDAASYRSSLGIEGNRLVDVDAFFQKIEDCRDDAKAKKNAPCSQAADTYPPKPVGFGVIPSGSNNTLTPPVVTPYTPEDDPCALRDASQSALFSGHDFGGCSFSAGDKGGLSALLLFIAIPLFIAARRKLNAR